MPHDAFLLRVDLNYTPILAQRRTAGIVRLAVRPIVQLLSTVADGIVRKGCGSPAVRTIVGTTRMLAHYGGHEALHTNHTWRNADKKTRRSHAECCLGISGGSIGITFGAETKSVLLAFMDDQALRQFQAKARADQSWQWGIDGAVALVDAGSQGDVNSATINQPIEGFVYDQSGLFFNLSLQGTKIAEPQR